MSGFTRLHLRNFKSWADSGDVRLAPITAFFGTNSSGKTSLLQSLLLLKQTAQSPDRGRVLDLGGSPNSLVELGTVHDIIHQRDDNDALAFSLDWTVSPEVVIQDVLRQARKLRSIITEASNIGLSTTLSTKKSGLQVESTEYRVGDTVFALSRVEGERIEYTLSSNNFDFVRNPGRAWQLPRPAKFYGFPDQVRIYFQNASFLSDLELRFEEQMAKVLYLGPLREDPRRQYLFSGGAPNDVGRRGELAIDALISSRTDGTRVTRGRDSRGRRLGAISVEALVASWLKELNLIHSFEVNAIDDRETVYLVEVKRSAESPAVLLTDVGFGVSQVLPVLVLLAYAQEGDTILLEQPEIHLHPAVQSKLADILIETAKARNVQIIVESHSEHLLARLQRRVAEETLDRGLTLTPDDVALYFVSYDSGRSLLKELEIDLFGTIKNWPKDFFGDRGSEILATLEAQTKRKTS